MPALPSASCLAEGLDTISIASILSELMFCSRVARSAPDSRVGIPLICICTPSFPSSEMLSSISTLRKGKGAVFACRFPCHEGAIGGGEQQHGGKGKRGALRVGDAALYLRLAGEGRAEAHRSSQEEEGVDGLFHLI